MDPVIFAFQWEAIFRTVNVSPLVIHLWALYRPEGAPFIYPLAELPEPMAEYLYNSFFYIRQASLPLVGLFLAFTFLGIGLLVWKYPDYQRSDPDFALGISCFVRYCALSSGASEVREKLQSRRGKWKNQCPTSLTLLARRLPPSRTQSVNKRLRDPGGRSLHVARDTSIQ